MWKKLFRRDVADDRFPVERTWGWELQLSPDTQKAFMEGLRAYHDAGNPVRLHGEHGTLTMSGPPRAISLYVLADRFAVLGKNALKDPEGSVAGLLRSCVAADQPGVLHLRERWLEGEVGGLDRAGVLAAVRAAVGDLGTWYGDADLGFAAVVNEENTLLIDLGEVAEQHRADPSVSIADIVKRLVDAGDDGVTWVKPAE
ncbi:hypothetical protein OIE66_04725 [Nonomuraea sp. NBC_01738]|uniref:hypothetical protein n=1 Tax=Nonomuraea sp. NBC_01738 TaxID=2976003 RepID=UPI002E0E86FC|nr:hypothetical protein OIE66_04725 [Nonomuraea sp. NBC_01738]